CSARVARVEGLPVLLARVRWFHGALAVDDAILCAGVWLRPQTRCAPGGVFRAARGYAARGWRLALGPVRRAARHLVGALGCLDCALPAVLSANGFHGQNDRRAAYVPHSPATGGLHSDSVRAWRGTCVWHGFELQVRCR